MKLRWREHERMLVTLTGVLFLATYLWRLFGSGAGSPESTYGAPFEKSQIVFNIYRNLLLPDIGMGLLIYLAYLSLNFFIIPRIIRNRGFFKKALWASSLIVLFFSFVLGALISIYYKNEWQYQQAGFSIFPKKGSYPYAQIDIHGNIKSVLMVLGMYLLYTAFRETAIKLIERSGQRRPYRIMIANQVTAISAGCFLLIPISIELFGIRPESPFYTVYFSLLSSVIFLMANLYWLFPSIGERSFFKSRFLLRFISLLVVCSLPGFFFGVFFLLLLFQLFMITPLSGLLYRQRKVKILQLRGLEKALVRSKADLQFLRSQLNPHFLFNALNTLYGTALQGDAQHTAEGIQKLGDMMRFMLHENNLDFIPMNREIEYLGNYISLQKLRTQSSAGMIIEDLIQSHPCNHPVAPMLFIPFVENAFKHGVSLNEKSWIKIKLDCDDRAISFEVRNSVHPTTGNDPEESKSGIGLKNVKERLELIYHGKYLLNINKTEKEFVIKLSIQIK